MVPSSVSAKTVLVADDTGFVRDRFTAALEGAGHQAVTVRSSAELLARVRADSDRLDLLIINLRLGRGTGTDLVRAVRKLDTGKLPILVFSGTISSANEVRELAALGVSGYINEYSAPHHIVPSLAPHLFPDSFNRRNSPRVILGIPVAYRFGNTIATAISLDLGKGGMAVRTMSPLERGSVMRLRFRLPGSRHESEVGARVAWTDRRVGMGLAFERVEPADQSAIDDFIDNHFFNKR
jgi:uncharacterized protein (TIGR02266 family)